MDILCAIDQELSSAFIPTRYIKQQGRWVSENRLKSITVNINSVEFCVEGVGSMTLFIPESRCNPTGDKLRVCFDGATGGILSVSRMLPNGELADLDQFSIGFLHPASGFFVEIP